MIRPYSSVISFNKKSSLWYKDLNKDTYYIHTDEKIVDVMITSSTKYIYTNNLGIKQYEEIMKFIVNNFDCYVYPDNSIAVSDLVILNCDNWRKEPCFIKENLLKILPKMIDDNIYEDQICNTFYNIDILDYCEELNKFDFNNLTKYIPIMYNHKYIARLDYIDKQNHSAIIHLYNTESADNFKNNMKNICKYELKCKYLTDEIDNVKALIYMEIVPKE